VASDLTVQDISIADHGVPSASPSPNSETQVIIPTDLEFIKFVGGVPGTGLFLVGSSVSDRVACFAESGGPPKWNVSGYQVAAIPHTGSPILYDLLHGRISWVSIENGRTWNNYELGICSQRPLAGIVPDMGFGVAVCQEHVTLFSLKDGTSLETLTWRLGAIPRVSPDGQLVVAPGASPNNGNGINLLEAYSLKTKKLLFSVPAHVEKIRAWEISTSGKWIATVSGSVSPPETTQPHQRELRVWRSVTGQMILDDSFTDIGEAVAFSSDSHWLAAAFGNRVYVYSTSTWKCAYVYTGHRLEYDRMPNRYNHNSVTALAASTNPLGFLSADTNGEIHIWCVPESLSSSDERSPI